VTDARAQILSRIRAALRGVPEVALPPAEPVPEGAPYRAAIASSLVERFVQTAEALGARVLRAKSAELPNFLTEILQISGAERAALSEELTGLVDALRGMGFEVGGPEVAHGADVGITGAEFGLAD
jgi:L-lactate utilization protein LutC